MTVASIDALRARYAPDSKGALTNRLADERLRGRRALREAKATLGYTGSDVPELVAQRAIAVAFFFGIRLRENLEAGRRACRICGCWEFDACPDGEGRGCGWAGPTLCTACMPDDGPLILGSGGRVVR